MLNMTIIALEGTDNEQVSNPCQTSTLSLTANRNMMELSCAMFIQRWGQLSYLTINCLAIYGVPITFPGGRMEGG